MFGLGAGELLLIFVIAILFLGPKKIPELAKGLGQAFKEFQKARDDMMTEINKPHPDTAKKADVEVAATKVESVESTDSKTSESPKHS
jgi:sec-independent protein translocase protein TatA